VRSLVFPEALHVAGAELYFSTAVPNKFLGYDVRSVCINGGDVTVRSPEFSTQSAQSKRRAIGC
jgi:hypothetical protein